LGNFLLNFLTKNAAVYRKHWQIFTPATNGMWLVFLLNELRDPILIRWPDEVEHRKIFTPATNGIWLMLAK
jgi:hypothetical protein